jgi:hypothetical protein
LRNKTPAQKARAGMDNNSSAAKTQISRFVIGSSTPSPKYRLGGLLIIAPMSRQNFKRRGAGPGPVPGPGPCDGGANNQLSDTQISLSEKYAKWSGVGQGHLIAKQTCYGNLLKPLALFVIFREVTE